MDKEPISKTKIGKMIQKSGLQRAIQTSELFREQMEASLSLNKLPDECIEKVKSFFLWHKGVTRARETATQRNKTTFATWYCEDLCFHPVVCSLPSTFHPFGAATPTEVVEPQNPSSQYCIQMIHVYEGWRGAEGQTARLQREETLVTGVQQIFCVWW